MATFDADAFDTDGFSTDAFDIDAGGGGGSGDEGGPPWGRGGRFHRGFRTIIFFLLLSL